ncbi:MAG: SwmB domain-containing protein [Cyanobacteriota bacterium]|nr:SwmB domain-containing protein [Cyanobacteriota bacterium]
MAVSNVSTSGNTVELVLSSPIENDQKVTVAYTDPSASNDGNAIQDPQGNDALSLGETDVANYSTVPGTAPIFQSIETTSDGRILLHYSEPLSVSVAASSRFEVIVNSHWRDGAAQAKSVAVSNVSTSGNTVELVLSSPLENDQTITVAYTDPSASNDGNAIQDPAGNDVLSLAAIEVSNISTLSGTSPVVPDDEIFEVSADGSSIVLSMSERISSSLPSPDQFSISHLGFEYGAGSNEVTAVSVDDKDLTLTLSQPIRNDQPITLSYNDPSPANDVLALQDPEGNDVSTFSINRYLNLSVVSGTGPVFQGAETTNDGRIVLTYDQPLDSSFEALENFDDGFRNPSSSLIATSAFEVTVDSPAIQPTIVPVEAVVVDGATATLTLRDAVENDQTTTVAYTDPSASNDTTSLQDRQGNDVSSLAETSVANQSTVPGTPPTFVSAAVSSDGLKVELLFSEPLHSTAAAADAFEVMSGERIKSITDVAVSSSSITLTLEDVINKQQAVVVSYDDPSDTDDSVAIQDPSGNDVLSFERMPATNLSTVEGDGLVEGTKTTGYKFISHSEPVPFINRLSQRLSDTSSGAWDVIEAKPSSTGFDILLHGVRAREPWYMHWSADPSGVLRETREWVHVDDMADSGLENLWDTDFDGNGVIGQSALKDADSNGLADHKVRYTVPKGGSGVVLSDRFGRSLSDYSSPAWDVIHVQPNASGFEVLIVGENAKGQRFSKRQADASGRIKELRPSVSEWRTGEQMMRAGEEVAYNIDFNGDETIGLPPVFDQDADGFSDVSGDYRLFRNGFDVALTNKRGRGFSDASSGVWDATKSIVEGDGFAVLLEGSGRLAGRYLVWDVGGDGVIKKTNGWYSADEMMEEGYETTFDRDFNGDNRKGVPPLADDNGDGFVDGGGEYRLFHGGTAQRLTNKRGQGFSDASSGVWDATKSIVAGDGFAVLLEGSGRLAGRYLVWDVGGDGVIKKTNGWYSADEMMEEGYETAFDRDFNGDGITGIPPAVDADGDGLVDGGGSYRLFRNDAAVDLQNKRGRRYSDASSDLWNVTKAVIDADGFDVLLTGSGRLDGQYLVWDVGTDGVIARANGWSTSQRLTQLGYGALFT